MAGLRDLAGDMNFAVDPNHAAGVLAQILSAAAGPGVDPTTGFPTDQPQTPPESLTVTGVTQTPTAPTTAPTTEAPGGVAKPFEGEAPIASPFGVGRGDHTHGGIDFGVPVGSTMRAAISGTVTSAGGAGDYGNMVEITGANGISVRYGHLSDMDVQQGDTVVAGQVVGMSGGAQGAPGAGNSTGPHLHFEVRQNGQAVDPAPFLAGATPIVGGPATTNKEGVKTSEPLDVNQLVAAQLSNIVDAVTGKMPTHQISVAGKADDLQANMTPGGGTPNAPGTPGAASGSWATDILEGIGAPVTPDTIAAMEAWMRYEGGAVHNNPLNTTQDMPGATNWNDIGVKTYTDYQQGLAATVRTLLQGNMGPIVAALRSGGGPAVLSAAVGRTPWNNYTPVNI